MRLANQTKTAIAGRNEQGALLIISLIFMLLLILSATTTMRTSTLGLRMAGNEETRVSTAEMTQSIVDERGVRKLHC